MKLRVLIGETSKSLWQRATCFNPCTSVFIRGLVITLLFGIASGCKKSETPVPPPSGTAASAANSAIILRLHWLGKDKIAGETNAAGLMRIWQEPESARVEEQTIEKLSHAPWRLLSGDDKATNAANALLLPVLNDLVRAESYLEVTERGEGREERGEGKAETGKAESRNGTSEEP